MSTPRITPPSRRARHRAGTRAPLLRFALAGLLAVTVVGAIGVTVQRTAAREDAIDDAKMIARVAGKGIVEGNVTPALLRGDPAAIAHIDAVVRPRISAVAGIERVKLWSGDGTIIYSDRPG